MSFLETKGGVKMKILLCIIIILLLTFSLSSCLKTYEQNQKDYYQPMGDGILFSSKYFDYFLPLSTTDVVTAQFINKRFFSTYWYELEFRVIDRIIGDAPDTIFIYEHNEARRSEAPFLNYNFDINPTYLLILSTLSRFSAISNFNENGYHFITGIPIINLNFPNRSTMWGRNISEYSIAIDFSDENLSSDEIIETVKHLVNNLTSCFMCETFIRGNDKVEIITNSENVLKIEILELDRIVDTDTTNAEEFNVKILDILKGDIDIELIYTLRFFQDTVTTGEKHIVAVNKSSITPWREGMNWSLYFISRHGIFDFDQLDEIKEIIASQENNY